MNYFGEKINLFSPSWYYLNELELQEQQEISELFKDFIDNDDNFAQPSSWDHNVKASYYHKNNANAPWAKWLDIIEPQINNFLKDVGTTHPVEVIPKEVWVNKYRPGDSQEYHQHCTPTTNISLVYFHTLNKDDNCNFQFHNGSSEYQLTGLSDLLHIPNVQYTIPETKQGSVIIFPSFYPHLVTTHRGTKQRITFAGNFRIVPQGWKDN